MQVVLFFLLIRGNIFNIRFYSEIVKKHFTIFLYPVSEYLRLQKYIFLVPFEWHIFSSVWLRSDVNRRPSLLCIQMLSVCGQLSTGP